MECKITIMLSILSAIVYTHHWKPENNPTWIQFQNQNQSNLNENSVAIVCYGGYKATKEMQIVKSQNIAQ